MSGEDAWPGVSVLPEHLGTSSGSAPCFSFLQLHLTPWPLPHTNPPLPARRQPRDILPMWETWVYGFDPFQPQMLQALEK